MIKRLKLFEIWLAVLVLAIFLIPAFLPGLNSNRENASQLKTIQALKYGQKYFDAHIRSAVQQDGFQFTPSSEEGFYTLTIRWRDIKDREMVLKEKEF